MPLLLIPRSSGAGSAPTVVSDKVINITKNSAVGFGHVTSAGSSSVTDEGFVVGTSANPTTANTKFSAGFGGVNSFIIPLTGLLPNTVYHARAYAINAVGTSYGADITFTTFQAEIVKYYYYKIYSSTTGMYVTTWTTDVLSDPAFKMVINNGPSQMLIELGRKYDDFGESSDVALNNRVECWCVNADNPNGKLIYSGYISGYRPIIDGVTEKLEVTVFGYVAELQRMVLRDSGGNVTITYTNMDPALIFKDVIDKYNAVGGHINYTPTSWQMTNVQATYTFQSNTIMECLNKILEMCPIGWYWRVDPDNTIYLQPKNIFADHTFLIGLHVEKLATFRRVENLINRVLFVGGGSPNLFLMYEHQTSQQTYGLYEMKFIDQRVTVQATAALIANRLLNQFDTPEIRSVYEIISDDGPGKYGYNIESIKPGMTLQISNLKAATKTSSLWDIAFWDTDVWDQTISASANDVLQIQSVDYGPDSVTIEASSRLPIVAKRIEEIERNLEVTQLVNIPTAPTPG